MKRRIGAKSYADILTVLLVIIIIAIIALLGYFAFKVIDKKNVETTASTTNDEFLAAAEENKRAIAKARSNEEGEVDVPSEIDYEKANAILNNGNMNNLALGGEDVAPQAQEPATATSNVEIKKTYLGNYEVKGSISIPKTNCNYPILEKVTVDSLKKSIAILDIVANPELNRTVKDLNVAGTNAFILGHNYRNGQFFSNNDKLAIGDTIKITDQTGTTVTYTIYYMFYTTPDDVSFMERDVDVNTREITLQTCNEDSSERLIIFAKDN
ncbi:MAG: sortase [Clostridia bacterium]|nr:sortase [Clostridia bacterium]